MEIRKEKREKKSQAVKSKSWIDFEPAFLPPQQAQEWFDWVNRQSFTPETGSCTSGPTHDTLHFGPRQAYLSCVPSEFRVVSSGPIPSKLLDLHNKIEQRYRAKFNSIQVNRHWNADSVVTAHSDNMHGDIVMLSLGQPRRFVLRYKHADKAKTLNRWKAGDIFFDKILPSGSLLTIFKNHQFDLTHEMPAAERPCGARISLIWRYIAESVVKGPLGRGSLMAGTAEYKTAQAVWLAGQGSASPP